MFKCVFHALKTEPNCGSGVECNLCRLCVFLHHRRWSVSILMRNWFICRGSFDSDCDIVPSSIHPLAKLQRHKTRSLGRSSTKVWMNLFEHFYLFFANQTTIYSNVWFLNWNKNKNSMYHCSLIVSKTECCYGIRMI